MLTHLTNSALTSNIMNCSLKALIAVAFASCITAPISTAVAERFLPIPAPGFDGGVALNGRAVRYSSPTIAEIDGDRTNGKEIAVTTADGILNVVRSDGTLAWSVALPSASCTQSKPDNRAYSQPKVATILGDGVPYVVATYGGLGVRRCDGGVVAFRGSDGARLWNFSLQQNARKYKYSSQSFGVFSAPALADVNGDGKVEIGFTSFDRNIYLLNSNGTLRWFYHAADTSWSTPTFADTNDDGVLEMIAATDITKNDRLRPPTKNGGMVYAFHTRQRSRQQLRLGFRNRAAYRWGRYLDQGVYASPRVADVLDTAPGKEIIVGASCVHKNADGSYPGNWIKILNSRTGAVLVTIPTDLCSSSSPAIVELDGDPATSEIVATVNGARALGGTGQSSVTAFRLKRDGSYERWYNTVPYSAFGNDGYGGNFNNPIVADLDGNGSFEIIAMNRGGASIISGNDGQVLSCLESESAGCPNGEFEPPFVGVSTNATAAVGDIDGDGALELVAAGGYSSARGALFAWSFFGESLKSQSGSNPPYAIAWR